MSDKVIQRQRILIADDETNIRKTLTIALEAEGHTVYSVSNGDDVLSEVRRRSFDIVLLDLRLGTKNGLELIAPMLADSPWMKIIVITAHASIETTVEAMRHGATDYLPKPFTPDQVSLVVQKAAQMRRLERRLDALEEAAGGNNTDIESANPAMQRLYEQARQVAESNATVLLRGANGTGKTMLARAMHNWSPRHDHTFSVVSCPSLSGHLLESELFGHVRGAFTGAVKDNPGRIAKSEGGTLFLDEIGDLPLDIQPKLLRFLQDREYERIGDTVTQQADVRLITATNVDLEAAVQAGAFREDLLYRLNVVELTIPPLRERREDIAAMAQAMLAKMVKSGTCQVTGIDDEALARLTAYAWPGNVRELQNTIERACIFCREKEIGVNHLPEHLSERHVEAELGDLVSLEAIEERHIRRVLSATSSLQEAATILGIDQATLWRRRKKYDI